MGAIDGSVVKLLPALVVTAVVAEISYRYIERPIREGSLERWWRRVGPARGRRLLLAPVAGLAVFVAVLVSVDADDPAVGGDATFELPTEATAPPAIATQPAVGAAAAETVAPPVTAAPPAMPIGLTIVGDSVGDALTSNLPDGLDGTLNVTNGGSSAACTTAAAPSPPTPPSRWPSTSARAGRTSCRVGA